ncbi:oligopeptide/dipeptide ABC transporter ATP-binding protein [Gellertiella hungarica]|uniref:Oligopeptide/dipeptide ABC transporter ATP-binding protein n=1 Tax=Gellertiella hungarica TaxID=1572859 RepID=A0A7W6J727_9HYPH|nr:ABC transporter ATP-binding protein [Gellertiella hungarica]MBB4065989.1 oligopeptide/dipeptide ABC transporter ATP-binding protein [Gellertiella hungarica]
MSEPLLVVKGLTKRFMTGGGWFARPRSMTAVRSVNLTVGRGEVVGVVGESGCGKSTLARLILRLIEPTEGDITLGGTRLSGIGQAELRRERRRMAMVFQDPYSSLDPRYTIAETLAEPFRVHGLPVTQQAISGMLEAVSLPASAALRYPHQMSGGQRQRIGIARALALRPEFVVLDEPTASLDVSIQAQIIELLAALREGFGLTYLFISHDLGLVRYFCDRIVVMYLGAVVEVLPDARAVPRHPYTRALMDSSFAPDPKARREIAPLSGEIPSPFNLPPGCAFAGRCSRAVEACRSASPPLTEEGGHAVACFNPL